VGDLLVGVGEAVVVVRRLWWIGWVGWVGWGECA